MPGAPEYCDFEEEFMEIILDPSFTNNRCLDHVYNKAGQASTFKDILQNFDEDFSVAHLKLSAGTHPQYPNVNAITYAPSNYIIEIQFNPNKLDRPSVSIARTMIHELIHAEIYRKLLSVAQQPSIPWSESFIKSIANDYPGLHDYYMRFVYNIPAGQNPTSAQHQAMA
ncbi:MAG: hypothetical protein AAFW89_15210, partial [Bacteroidota bacterium]